VVAEYNPPVSESQQREPVKLGPRRSVWLEFAVNRGEKRAIKRFHDTGPFARVLDRRRADRERRALIELARCGLRVPAPIAVGEGEGVIELATVWIENAVTLFDLVHDRSPWPVARESVAMELGRALALARRHGVTFADLHAKNVLVDVAGAVWLVDVAGSKVRGRELSDDEHARNVVTMTAELRETTPLAWRLRVIVACARELETGVRREQLARWNEDARLRRRAVVTRAVERWTRESSVTTTLSGPSSHLAPAPGARAFEHALRSRSVDEASAARALETGHPVRVEGDDANVLAAWRAAALFTEHALPSFAPIALATSSTHVSGAYAVFDDHAAKYAIEDIEHDRVLRRRAAYRLGCLLGALHDRGLTLASKLRDSIAFDESGRARFTPLATAIAGSPGHDATSLATPLARMATARERGLFIAGFSRSLETTRDARAAVRKRLSLHPSPAREPRRRRIRALALDGATWATKFVPHALVQSTLVAASRFASFSRFDRMTRENLASAYGPAISARELDAIARGVHRHAARQFAEWLRLANTRSGRHEWIDELVEIDASVAILERELARRSGALVVSAHIGNWELLAARLRRAGHAGAVVGYRRSSDSTAAWLEHMRENYGVQNIPQSAHPRAILRALDEGRVVGLLADLEVRRLAGEFAPFFGRQALTMSAPAALSRAARRPLLPASCMFDPNRGRYVIHFEEPLEARDHLDRRARVVDLCTRLNAVFERWIRAAPEQWAWHQPRWRTRPRELAPKPVHARRGLDPWPERVPSQSSLQAVDPGLSPD